MNLERVAFSIPTDSGTHPIYAAKKIITTLDIDRVMGKLVGNPSQCVIIRDRVLYPAFMLCAIDLEKMVNASTFVDDETLQYRIPGDLRQPVVVQSRSGFVKVFGKQRYVDHATALAANDAILFFGDVPRAMIF
jgi:hypothetical protein